MTDLIIRDIFDLPTAIPRCIVQIQDFDDEGTLKENIRDYVITDSVADEMARLVDRIVASCVRHEAGTGHYLHGSFGSGKSHFMAILGLILQNNPAIWAKDHPAIRSIRERHQAWLARHPILVVPVYMLGQRHDLQMACYNAANARLQRLGVPPCEFSDAGKVIESLRTEATRYGDVVYERFERDTGYDRTLFEEMAAGDQAARDELAGQILAYRDPSRAERAQLYPAKFSDGMAALTRHAQAHGSAGIVYLIDELILYLTGKTGREYADEFNSLVALADNSALDRAVPLWVIVAKQRNIDEIVPDDSSQQHIYEAMEHHKDRFPETTELADTELVPIVEERVLRKRAGMEQQLDSTINETLNDLPADARDTLLHDFTMDDFGRVYPFHPALIRTLIDVSARLSRERAAIRLLYELLIERHSDLPIGELIPYASLFDVVFLPHGLTGGSQNDELEAVRQTYYDRLLPVIEDMYPDPKSVKARRAHTLVKTILLCGLSKTMRSATTVERILHLNYQDLRGRTSFGSYEIISQILTELANRSELVHFTPKPNNPGSGVADITLASGVQLADVLRRVPVGWRHRMDAFNGLMKELLNKPIQNSEIPNYERTWRGSTRRARVRFANVAELAQSDMLVQEGHEFTLFIDYPFGLGEAHSRADARQTIERARARTSVPIGFWLPGDFSADDLRDLEEYARMTELESNPNLYLEEYGRTQRDDVLIKLTGQKRTKATTLSTRLVRVYKGSEAQVTFLDPSITPVLDVDSLGAALDRVADAVCDRYYPYHPHFNSPLNQRILGRLLEEFLVPAALGNGAVPRNIELDALLSRLGEPLELAAQGAANWTLRTQSRYLSKLDELAAGRRVKSDDIARGLTEAFGFTRELCDTFILYLIRGQGYRALRDDKPFADADFGRLGGLELERGQRLAVYEWARVKELIQETWQIQPAVPELTVAAQDRLWNQLNAAARNRQEKLAEARTGLVAALNEAGVALDAAPRLAVLDAARDLNLLAMRADMDPYEGLRALLVWQAEGAGMTLEEASAEIARCDQTRRALVALQTDTLNQIKTLAQRGNTSAQAVLGSVQNSLAATHQDADLTSHLLSWQEDARAIVTEVIEGHVPESEIDKEKTHIDEPRLQPHITSVEVEIDDQTIPLSSEHVEKAMGEWLDQVEAQAKDGEVEAIIRIIFSRKQA